MKKANTLLALGALIALASAGAAEAKARFGFGFGVSSHGPSFGFGIGSSRSFGPSFGFGVSPCYSDRVVVEETYCSPVCERVVYEEPQCDCYDCCDDVYVVEHRPSRRERRRMRMCRYVEDEPVRRETVYRSKLRVRPSFGLSFGF